MRYNTEHQLIRDFHSFFLRGLPRTKHYVALNEFETTWGIVDILVVGVRKSALTRRRKELASLPVPPLTNLAALSLGWLKKHPRTTVSSLSDFLETNNGVAKKTVGLLEQRGLVRVYKNGKLHLRSCSNAFVVTEILAFEAKLNNWQKAVEQAERHLWFTNNSYVVMPELSTKTIARVSEICRLRGLGFITLDFGDQLIVRTQPLHNYHADSYFSWKINEFLVDKGYHDGRSNH